MNEQEIEKLNQVVVKMRGLDIDNFLESKTKEYQDIEQIIQDKKEIFKTILVLKYKIFILEKSRKKWILYSFFVTLALLSIIGIFF